MQKVKQLIDEVRELKKEPTHKSALRIYALMENNTKLFADILDNSDLNYLLTGFENISHKNPGEFNDTALIEEYSKLCENFLFHCSRVV